jgi:phage tail-like protein
MAGNTLPGLGGDPILGQSFFLDLQNQVQGYFTQCSGFSNEHEVITDKSADKLGRIRIRKIPGPISYSNITLSKGITDSKQLWEWITAVSEGKIADKRVNGTISLCDPTGKVVAQWTVQGVWPTRVTAPTLTADGGQVGVEELELTIEGFTRVKV